MAGRVNTKFLVIFSSILLVVFCAVAAVGYTTLKGRPSKFIEKGDAFAAQGNWEEASKAYERAVGYDRTRLEWLEKWRDAVVKTTPNNRARYEDQYNFYRNILRTIAVLRAQDPAAQLAYVDEADRLVRSGGTSREGLEMIIKETTERLRDLPPDDAGTKRVARYRGAAQADRMSLIKVEQEEKDQALKDLEAAAAADPKDHVARIALARWYLAEAERYRADRRPDLEEEPRAKAREVLTALSNDLPDHPEVALALYLTNQSDKLRIVESASERLAIIESMRSEAMKVIDACLAAPVEQLTVDHVDRVVSLMSRTIGQDAIAPLMSLTNRMLEKHPTDARMMLAKGVLLQESGKIDEALAQFEAVVNLPDLPVGLEGLLLPERKMSALAFQVDCAVAKWNDATTDEERAQSLAKAKEYRDRLVRDAGVRGKGALLLREAKIAYIERRWDETVAKLAQLRGMGGQAARSLEVLQILAQALMQQQAFGESKIILEEMLEIAPSIGWTHATLGEVNTRLGEIDEARRHYETAVRIEPDNTSYKERLTTLRTLAGVKGPDERVDPVISALLDARKMRDGGDLIGARKRVETLVTEYPDDLRVVNELVQLDVLEGAKPAALARVEKMLEKFPTNDSLKRLKRQLTIEDPVEAALAMIEDSDLTPGLKALERFQVFVQSRREADAAKALEEAERLEPENPRVLDMGFVVSLGKKDFAKAQRIAQTAARLDIDQLGGLLYQGRLELIEGEEKPEKLQAAVRTFEDAVKRVPYNPTVRKLLAQAYARSGRSAEAVEAYKRAYEGKPDDLIVARDYALVLLQLNRGKEALEVIHPDTGILRFHPTNRDMLSMWMDLESRFGDRARAAAARAELRELEPDNVLNKLALAQMYLEEKKWDEARTIIDDLDTREGVNKVATSRLRANILAAQGDVDGGVKVLQDAIAAAPPELMTSSYLTLGDFFLRNNRFNESAAAMRKARETQNPDVMEADRSLGDLYFDAGSNRSQTASNARDSGDAQLADKLQAESNEFLGISIQHYEAVIAGVKNADDVRLVKKRLAETYLRLARFDDAKRIVDDVAQSEPDDMQIILLQGAIAAEKGDRRAARQFYDRAVTLDQANPNSFLQRALFNMNTPDEQVRKTLIPDILQDLKAVTDLRPTMITAWGRRYGLLKETGQSDQAFAVLRQAIQSNPNVDDLRLMLLRELASIGRFEELQTEILRTVEARPDEIRWLRLGGNLLASQGIERWREASDLLGRYFDKDPKPENAGPALDALLRSGPNPPRARIQELLKEFEKLPALEVSEQNPQTFVDSNNLFRAMLRARARFGTGQNDQAEKLLDEALAMTADQGMLGQVFMNYLIIAKGGKPDSAIEWITAKQKKGPINPYLENVVLSSRRGKEPASQIIERGDTLLSRATDDMTRVEILKTLSSLHYGNKSYQLSADRAREAIEIIEKSPNASQNPAYIEMLNNLAYTLLSHLDNPKDGLPYAIKAAELLPNSATVLDTLGWCHYKLKDYPKAIEVLSKAVSIARDVEEGFISTLHLGLAQAATGDKSSARRSLREAEAAEGKSQSANQPEYKAQLEELRKAVE